MITVYLEGLAATPQEMEVFAAVFEVCGFRIRICRGGLFKGFLRKTKLQQLKQMIFKIALGKKNHLVKLTGEATIDDLKKAVAQAYKLGAGAFALCYLDEEGDEITLSDEHDYAILVSSGLKAIKVRVQLLEGEISTEQMEAIENVAQKKEVVEIDQEKPKMEEPKVEEPVFEVDESLIEEKLKKLLPGLVERVKTEIEDQQSERSRIYDQNQPLIVEEEELPIRSAFSVKAKEEEKKEVPAEEGKVVHDGVNCDGCSKKSIEGIRYKCAVCADFDFCEVCEGTKAHHHAFLKIRTIEQTPIKIIAIVRDQENNFEVNGHKIPASSGFEPLLNKGMAFLNSMCGQQQQQQQRCQPQHPFLNGEFFKNFFQSNFQNCQRNTETKPETKPEETKPESKPERKMQEKEAEVNEEAVLEKAQLLSLYGFDFTKCYQWAKTYPKLSMEELLDTCLSSPDFLSEK